LTVIRHALQHRVTCTNSGGRKRSIVQSGAVLLAVVDHPGDQFYQLGGTILRTVTILLIFVDDHPAKAGDGITIGGIRIRQRHLGVGGDLDIGGCGYAGDAGGDEIPRFILHFGVRHIVLDSIGQLDIANGAGRLIDQAGNTFVTLATETGGPVNGRAVTDFRIPFIANFREIGRKDIRGTAAVGTMRDNDRRRGEFHTLVDSSDAFIVPFSDLTQEDIGQDPGSEHQRVLYVGQVVAQYYRAGRYRDVNGGSAECGILLAIHGSVGSTEVHGLGGELGDPGARTYGLVVDLETIGLAVLGELF